MGSGAKSPEAGEFSRIFVKSAFTVCIQLLLSVYKLPEKMGEQLLPQ